MPRKTTEEDEDLLEDLGVDTESQDQGGQSARVQRIMSLNLACARSSDI